MTSGGVPAAGPDGGAGEGVGGPGGGAAAPGLPFPALLQGVAELLAPGGRLALVLPVVSGEADTVVRLAQAEGLALVHRVRVFTKATDAAERRQLLLFRAPEPGCDDGGSATVPRDESLHIYAEDRSMAHPYSEAYRRLTRDFHHPACLPA
ncbi:hypothetical protein V8C86DRAFT_2720380 [Haematococcus lacustris]